MAEKRRLKAEMRTDMLKIYYGEMEGVCYGPLWFKYSFDLKWFQDELVQQMILDVDKSKYVTGGVIDSPVLGPIPPEKLSGGVKTLIMIYKMPDKVEVLKVGHHGASGVVDKACINRLKPEVSIISTGKNNYGHPNNVTLDILRNTEIYRTDVSGTVTVQLNET